VDTRAVVENPAQALGKPRARERRSHPSLHSLKPATIAAAI